MTLAEPAGPSPETTDTRLAALLRHLPALLAPAEPDRVLPAAAEAARVLTGAMFALFEPADPAWTRTLVGLGWDDFADAPTPGLTSILGVEGNRARLVADVTRAADQTQLLYGVLRDGRLVRSWLIASIRGAGGQLHGALYVGHTAPNAFRAADQEQLALLSPALGVALDSARGRADRERVLVALEQSLLPPVLPSIPGIDLAARYRPAADATRVGGDFYDAFQSGDRRWSLMLGDVCGVGAEAAAVTGAVRSTVRGLVPELSPAAALERLNGSLDPEPGHFLTAVLIDVTPTTVIFANAGHPPPVLVHNGRARLLERGHGGLLGVFARVGAEDVGVDLQPGDALVLYTDGIIEARDQRGDEFGFDRLLELTEEASGRTAAGLARRIELAAVSHAAGTVDDIAVLVIRRRPARGAARA